MRELRTALVISVAAGLFSVGGAVGAAPTRGIVLTGRTASPSPQWVLSTGALPVGKDKAIGLKLDKYRVMWLGGLADDPADNNRTFIYDTRTRTFRETARIPAAKPIDDSLAAGVLDDGSVVIVGGALSNPASARSNALTVLSYRYDPRTDRWSRTGDLPEPQGWLFTPANLLRDGRLLLAGGRGLNWLATGAGSVHAFVFDRHLQSTVDVVDPATGRSTGKKALVQGRWDYTRRADGRETTLSGGQLFGNAVLLRDGRVFLAGGHTTWRDDLDPDVSVLSTATEFFDPATGIWSQGVPLPAIAGEDDRIANSHGGRTNGVCLAVLPNNKVVIAGGNSQVDGQSYFSTAIGRRSILVMTPAANARNSRYELSPNPIPPGTDAGGPFGDGGRNQLPCYVMSDGRVMLAGGQDTMGEDLYDTYVFDPRNWSVTRGPDLVHAVAEWGPQFGYPAGYEAAVISTRAVSMRNSSLVFDNDVLVHGGAFDGVSNDSLGSRYVEQFSGTR